jgi:hypothetical protein
VGKERSIKEANVIIKMKNGKVQPRVIAEGSERRDSQDIRTLIKQIHIQHFL